MYEMVIMIMMMNIFQLNCYYFFFVIKLFIFNPETLYAIQYIEVIEAFFSFVTCKYHLFIIVK